MKLFITGANGFIGSELVAYLNDQKKPKYEIHTAVRKSKKLKGIKSHTVDLLDQKAVTRLIAKVNPQAVYHLAGFSRISEDASMEDYYKVNFLTSIHVLRAIEKLKKPVRLFFASSMHVYGNQPNVVDENSLPKPLSHYAFTKLLAEQAVKQSVSEHEHITAVVGRLYSCFGPGQPEGFVASDLCRKIKSIRHKGAVLTVGPLDSYRRFLDVRDVVKVLPLLLNREQPNRFEIFNIASPYELEIGQMVKMLLKIAKKNPKVESSQSSHNQFKGLRMKLDKLYSVVSHDLFRPVETTLEDMLNQP